MGIKHVFVFVISTAVFIFFFWWGGVDFLQRSFEAAYVAFCCIVFGGLFAWWVDESF